MGGFLTFSYEFEANQLVSKQSLSVSISAQSMLYSGSASLSMEQEAKSNSVNVKKTARTNTQLPPECAGAAMGDDFDPDMTRTCMMEWMKYPATAAYGAYAVPYAFHPDYQDALNPPAAAAAAAAQDAFINSDSEAAAAAATASAGDTENTTAAASDAAPSAFVNSLAVEEGGARRRLLQASALDNLTYPMGDAQADFKFSTTGLLRMRLTRIQVRGCGARARPCLRLNGVRLAPPNCLGG
mgnify:CR=1 FL=1